MTWGRAVAVFLAGAVATSLTDWLFMAVLFHGKYGAFPEIWRRPRGGPGEGRAVALAAVVALLTPAAFTLACPLLGIESAGGAFALACVTWFMGPLPILVSNYLFIKFHPAILASHLLGWLVKLMALAAAVALLGVR